MPIRSLRTLLLPEEEGIFHFPFGICHWSFSITGVAPNDKMTNDKWQMPNGK
jgi:hypothetical protein